MPLKASAQWSAQWPGVCMTSIRSAPVSITSPSANVSSTLSSISSAVSSWARIGAPKRSASARAPTTWS